MARYWNENPTERMILAVVHGFKRKTAKDGKQAPGIPEQLLDMARGMPVNTNLPPSVLAKLKEPSVINRPS